MPVTFSLNSARDILNKANREYDRLKTAVESETHEELEIADSLFNFAVTIYHVSDWLLIEPGLSFSSTQLQEFISSSKALSACRDICTASKHREITHRKERVITDDVLLSAPSSPRLNESSPVRKLKFILKNTDRLAALATAKEAVAAWELFFETNNVP